MLAVGESQWEGRKAFETLLNKHFRYILGTWQKYRIKYVSLIGSSADI